MDTPPHLEPRRLRVPASLEVLEFACFDLVDRARFKGLVNRAEGSGTVGIAVADDVLEDCVVTRVFVVLNEYLVHVPLYDRASQMLGPFLVYRLF